MLKEATEALGDAGWERASPRSAESSRARALLRAAWAIEPIALPNVSPDGWVCGAALTFEPQFCNERCQKRGETQQL